MSAVDTIIAGVHYPPELSPFDVGYRAVAVNLSDFAAMGARPRWMTLALSISTADSGWLSLFAEGLFAAAAQCKVSLIGGDTTRGPTTVVSVQMLGDVDPKAVIRRSGAARGDAIFVTGSPGDAAAGLYLLDRGSDQSTESQYLIGRFVRPTARVSFAAAIAGLISSAIDVSDGLYADLEKLVTASKSGAQLEIDRLPLSSELLAEFGIEKSIEFALTGGDDYELCFTASRSMEAEIQAQARAQRLQVTRIGEVVGYRGIRSIRNGETFDFAHPGYRHF